MLHTVYGPGGFDPSAPNNNVVAEFDDGRPPAPLDAVGALATLLAVTEVVSVGDAANAVGLPVEALVVEAEGWAYGAAVNGGGL